MEKNQNNALQFQCYPLSLRPRTQSEAPDHICKTKTLEKVFFKISFL